MTSAPNVCASFVMLSIINIFKVIVPFVVYFIFMQYYKLCYCSTVYDALTLLLSQYESNNLTETFLMADLYLKSIVDLWPHKNSFDINQLWDQICYFFSGIAPCTWKSVFYSCWIAQKVLPCFSCKRETTSLYLTLASAKPSCTQIHWRYATVLSLVFKLRHRRLISVQKDNVNGRYGPK